jgi:hypothetical protein
VTKSSYSEYSTERKIADRSIEGVRLRRRAFVNGAAEKMAGVSAIRLQSLTRIAPAPAIPTFKSPSAAPLVAERPSCLIRNRPNQRRCRGCRLNTPRPEKMTRVLTPCVGRYGTAIRPYV